MRIVGAGTRLPEGVRNYLSTRAKDNDRSVNAELVNVLKKVMNKGDSAVNANNEITGRDSFIIAKALVYAIASIQSLPDEKQEWSDMSDMCALVRTHAPSNAAIDVYTVHVKTGFRVNLWPNSDEAIDPAWKAEFDRTVEQLEKLKLPTNSI